jgi:polysaccharide biosynthesis transport protein
MDNNHQLVTPAADLFAPSSRFDSSSSLYDRLHRWQLLLRRFWWVVSLVLIIVLAPVYFYTAAQPPAYQSKARMWLTGKLNLGEGRLYTEELVDYLATQSEVLGSSTIQQRALANLRTQFTNDLSAAHSTGRNPGFRQAQKVKVWLESLAGLDPSETNAPGDGIPFKVQVTESSKSSILELRATGTDPVATRRFLNCLMAEYFTFKKEGREDASERTLVSVTGEVRQLAEELKAQQEKLHAFQSSNNVVFLQEQGNSAGSYLAQLNRQIASLRTQLQLLQRLNPEQWRDVESRRATQNSPELAEAGARETLANLAGPQAELFRASQQMELLKAKRDELGRFLRPLHPKIRKLNEEVATQEKLVQISRDEALKQLANRREALQLEIRNLESAFQEWDIKAIESSRKMADYDSMRLGLQRLQTAYDRLFGVMQTVDVGKTVDQENVGVLESASVAKPIPRMIINMFIAAVAAFALSFACLYGLGILDDRFASLTELSDHLSADVLGQIPAIALKRPKGQLGIAFFERQRFEFLESFRNIRSSLLYMSNGAPRPKTILITSSVPREGKSTVALYLSATLALGHSRVLLIDGDMRRSSLHKFFGVKPGPGLAEILSREVPAARAIIPSTMENLSLLPAGTATRNPGELVLSPAWARLMGEVGPQFDYVLIDSPPLLATDDASSLAHQVDGVLFVVRGSFTSARAARKAVDTLQRRHAKVLGLVFNRAASLACEYHSYQRYRHSYGWEPRRPKGRRELAASEAVHSHGS